MASIEKKPGKDGRKAWVLLYLEDCGITKLVLSWTVLAFSSARGAPLVIVVKWQSPIWKVS